MRNQKGFTLIEIIAVLAVLFILGALAVTSYLDLTAEAKAKTAQAQVAEIKSTLSLAYAMLLLKTGSPPSTGTVVISEAGFTSGTAADIGTTPDVWNVNLTDAGTLVAVSIISRNGDTDFSATGTWNIPNGTSLTSMGSTFAEITGAMIAKVKEFYEKNSRYPRSWGDYAFTDVGLDPTEWQNAFDGIHYATGGNRIKVTPADGYTFHMTGADGNERVLKSSYNWSLWYSMADGKWYYHRIEDGNEINITTLVVVR